MGSSTIISPSADDIAIYNALYGFPFPGISVGGGLHAGGSTATCSGSAGNQTLVIDDPYFSSLFSASTLATLSAAVGGAGYKVTNFLNRAGVLKLSPITASFTVVAFGDSKTKGYDGTQPLVSSALEVFNGWRATVDQDCISGGYSSLNWVGTLHDSSASYVPTRNHEGQNGCTCARKIASASGLWGAGQPLHGVQVCIVSLGTNDGVAGVNSNFATMIQGIFSSEPQVRFVIVGCDALNLSAVNIALFRSGGICDTLQGQGIPIYRAPVSSPPLIQPDDFVNQSGDVGLHEIPSAYIKVGHTISPYLLKALQGT